VSAHSAGAYTATLLVIVNVMRGGGRAPPILPARANFTLMTECTPESNGCYSVYSVVFRLEVPVYNAYITNQFQTSQGGGGVEKSVSRGCCEKQAGNG
jgi:hypothetical protein